MDINYEKTRKVDGTCFIIGPILNSTLLLNDPRNESAARPAIEQKSPAKALFRSISGIGFRAKFVLKYGNGGS